MISIILHCVAILSAIIYPYSMQCNAAEEKSFSTSVAGMEQLIYTERMLIDVLENYVLDLQDKVDTLKHVLSELKAENERALKDPELYLHNPLNGYSLIRRMHQDWNIIKSYMGKHIGDKYTEAFHPPQTNLPTSLDLHEASDAIFRLQITYDLQPSDMAEGLLNGRQYSAKLKSIDRYFMGHHLMEKSEYYNAGFWIESALDSYEASPYTRAMAFGKDKLWLLYAKVLLNQNRPGKALTAIKNACDLAPEDTTMQKLRSNIEYMVKVNTHLPDLFLKPGPNSYQLGCRGEYTFKSSHLHCTYNATTSPFLRLAPLKMEILRQSPYVVLYHDVITQGEIEQVLDMAKQNLTRSKVYNPDFTKSVAVESRTSQFTYLPEDFSNTTLRIHRRIRDMTGFYTNDSEKMQVMNYGLGGHYDNHYDFFNVSDSSDLVRLEGDRICTVLFYLSDVEQGGATAFPNIQMAVFPRKGSAVVWYNLGNELEPDTRTLHAACPVIVGSKWVANKWIRAKDQVFKKPCYKL